MLGFSLYLPAGVRLSPIWIRPFKNVPVVRINLLQFILLPFNVIKPFIALFENVGVGKIVQCRFPTASGLVKNAFLWPRPGHGFA